MSEIQDRDVEPAPSKVGDDSPPLMESQGDPTGAPGLADLIDGPPASPPKTASHLDDSLEAEHNESVEHVQEYGSGGQDAGSMD